MTEDVAARYATYNSTKEPGYSGMGTTLSANPLQFAAMRAMLEEVMTEENYAYMEDLASRLETGIAHVIEENTKVVARGECTEGNFTFGQSLVLLDERREGLSPQATYEGIELLADGARVGRQR